MCRSQRLRYSVPLIACLLIVIGAKAWLIGNDASPTPYWDQWDAEAAFLFKPYLDGSLPLSQFFALHNEHRILFTRILALVLLRLDIYWDPVLEMLVNALIHSLAIGTVLAFISPILDRRNFWALCFFAAIIFSIPFGWENTLAGFQSQFYFLGLFSFLSLFFSYDAAAWDRRWWLGTLFAIASYFSMAGGVMTVASIVVLHLLQVALHQRAGYREGIAVALHGLLLIVMWYYIPALPGHASLRAHSFAQFLGAFANAASWPAAAQNSPVAMRMFLSVAVYAPVLFLIGTLIKQRVLMTDRRWFVCAVGLWVGFQIFSLAYGRALATTSSRYLDIFIFGLVTDFACLLYLLQNGHERGAAYAFKYSFTILWLLSIFLGIGQKVVNSLPAEIAEKHRTGVAQTANLQNFLATGDFGFLDNKPYLEIPYPSAQRLSEVVSAPEIRSILPPILLGESASRLGSAHGLLWLCAFLMATFKSTMLKFGFVLIPAGLALFLATATSLSSIVAPLRSR